MSEFAVSNRSDIDPGAAESARRRASQWIVLGYCLLAVDAIGLLAFHGWWIVWLVRAG